MKKQSISRHLERLGIAFARVDHEGEEYVVTHDTGECSFGSDGGGSAAFAYDATDRSDETIETYGEFCDVFAPTVDRGVAVAAAKIGLRLAAPGACDPVLDAAEFLRIRDSAE